MVWIFVQVLDGLGGRQHDQLDVAFLRFAFYLRRGRHHLPALWQQGSRPSPPSPPGKTRERPSKEERFLQPYREARDEARKLEDQLRQLILDSPEQQARNEKAIQAHQEWQSFAEQTIAMARVGQDVSDLKLQLRGKELMDRYREARTEFATGEQQLRDERQASSRRTLRFVNVSVVALCLLLGGAFSILGRKQLVSLSGAFNAALDTAEAKAAEVRTQKEWSHTILHSIGDAVIATDAEGGITFMNPVAETLTGWTLAEARHTPLADVFRIVNEQTRETVENPIDKVRRLNRVVGLANHTVLISKSGQEFAIDDSGSPTRDVNGKMAGIVLVFRDVTQQRSLEAALRSNERLAKTDKMGCWSTSPTMAWASPKT